MKNWKIGSGVLLIVIILIAIFLLNKEETKEWHIAIVSLTEVDKSTVTGFKDRLSELSSNDNVKIIYHDNEPAKNIENLNKIANSIKNVALDLVFVSSTPATQAVKRAVGGETPIVFSPVNDPIGSNIVKNLQKPDGKITGIKLAVGDGLRLKWLKEIIPNANKIYIPYTIGDKSALTTLIQIRESAKLLNLTLIEEPLDEKVDIDEFIGCCVANMDAIFIPRDSRMESKIESFVEFSLKNKIPLSAPSATQVEKGSLFSYGHIHYELGKQASRLAYQILKGQNPQNLPVEISENYLAINLKSAKEIGVEIPRHILKQAKSIVR